MDDNELAHLRSKTEAEFTGGAEVSNSGQSELEARKARTAEDVREATITRWAQEYADLVAERDKALEDNRVMGGKLIEALAERDRYRAAIEEARALWFETGDGPKVMRLLRKALEP